jgi:L-lactate dehydrogenase
LGEKPFYKGISDNKDIVGKIDLDKLVFNTANAGWKGFNRKETTYYSITETTIGIIKDI